MTDLNSLTPSQDERILAALSHVSVLIPMTGVIAPIIIWVTQKEKSLYVAYQALQALIFQLVMIAAWILGWGCYLFTTLIVFIPLAFLSSPDSHTTDTFGFVIFLIPVSVMVLIFLGGFILTVYGLIAAVMVAQGKPFRYIIIGNRVKHFMSQKHLTSDTQ